MFNLPILLLTYNRTSHLEKIISVLKQINATNLFVSSDGPQDDEDTKRVDTVRTLLADQLTWTNFKKNYSDRHLGCRLGVSTAIDWFFDQNDCGIILEDDCIPNPVFFLYAKELLSRYSTDTRILSIAGDTLFPISSSYSYSYFFSKFAHVWGWATWKRAWKLYSETEQQSATILNDKYLKTQLAHLMTPGQLSGIAATLEGKIDTWDYIWKLTHILQHGLAILPRQNMVTNVGFGDGATHTKYVTSLANQRATPIKFPLKHPPFYLTNHEYDKQLTKTDSQFTVLLDIILTGLKNRYLNLFSH